MFSTLNSGLLLQIISRESCAYADCDFADYADGPIKYKLVSMVQAGNKKNPAEQEKQP